MQVVQNIISVEDNDQLAINVHALRVLKLNVLRRKKHCGERQIAVNLNGGFGNQLFQFATATQYALTNDSKMIFNFSDNNRHFELDSLDLRLNQSYLPKIINGDLIIEEKSECKKCKFATYSEESFRYKALPNHFTHIEFSGYFQSPLYFDQISIPLRKFLTTKLQIEKRSQTMVVVHARLGDMAINPGSRQFHGIINDGYISKALECFQDQTMKVKVVTEDRAILTKELPLLSARAHEIQTSTLKEDFKTLCEAKRLVISNSTFSWWAGWISEADVVAPKAWFSPEVLKKNPTTDLFLPQWTII